MDAGPAAGRDAGRLAGAAMTLRNLAAATFVLAAFLYGQADNGDRAHAPQAAAKAPSR